MLRTNANDSKDSLDSISPVLSEMHASHGDRRARYASIVGSDFSFIDPRIARQPFQNSGVSNDRNTARIGMTEVQYHSRSIDTLERHADRTRQSISHDNGHSIRNNYGTKDKYAMCDVRLWGSRLSSHTSSPLKTAPVHNINLERANVISNALMYHLPRLGFAHCLCSPSIEKAIQSIAKEFVHVEMSSEQIFCIFVRAVYESHFDQGLRIPLPTRSEIWSRQRAGPEQRKSHARAQCEFKWPVFDMAQFEFGNARPGTSFDNVIILTNLPRAAMKSAEELLAILSYNLFTVISDPIQVALPSISATGRTKGYAFLEFENLEVTRLAVLAVDGLQWGEHPHECIRSELFRKYQSVTPMTATADLQSCVSHENISHSSETNRNDPMAHAFDGENQQDLSEDFEDLDLAGGSTSSDSVGSEGEITSFLRDFKTDKEELYEAEVTDNHITPMMCTAKCGTMERHTDSDEHKAFGMQNDRVTFNNNEQQRASQRNGEQYEQYEDLGRQINSAMNDTASAYSNTLFLSSRLHSRSLNERNRNRIGTGTDMAVSSEDRRRESYRSSKKSDVSNETAHDEINGFRTCGSLRSNQDYDNNISTPMNAKITEPWKDYCEELVCRNRELQEQVVASRQCMMRQGQNNQRLHLIVDRLERDRDGLLFENDLLQAQINAYEEHEQHYDAIVKELNALQSRLKHQQNVWELHSEASGRLSGTIQNPCWMQDTPGRRDNDRIQTLQTIQAMSIVAFEGLPCERIVVWEQALENALAKARIVRESKAQQLQEELNRQADSQNDQKTCVICLTHEKSILCLPCRHLCMCNGCSSRDDIMKCPICRLDIDEKLKIYS